MYHIFIHSSVNEHLGCFHVLVIVNSAKMNVGMHVCFFEHIFLLENSKDLYVKIHLPNKSTIMVEK